VKEVTSKYARSEAVVAAVATVTDEIEDILREKVNALELVLQENDLLSFKFITLNDLQLILLDRIRTNI
jgi:hypothetical protein